MNYVKNTHMHSHTHTQTHTLTHTCIHTHTFSHAYLLQRTAIHSGSCDDLSSAFCSNGGIGWDGLAVVVVVRDKVIL